MDFQEYMLAINATTLSSPEDKLTWVFNVFDGDGGGTIDANEINTMMVGLFEMAGAKVNEEQLAVRLLAPQSGAHRTSIRRGAFRHFQPNPLIAFEHLSQSGQWQSVVLVDHGRPRESQVQQGTVRYSQVQF